VFERQYGGFLSTFGEGHDPDASQITNGLGTRWEVERIVIKPYAAMGGIHSPLDALFDVGAKRTLKANEIARIECDVSHAVYHHGWWVPERPLTPIGAQMNIGYALAVAVLDGAAMVQQFSPSRIDADDVWALIPRIEVRHDPAFDVGGMLKRGQTRLAVTFTDGERIVVERTTSRVIEKPQSTGEVAQKYRTLTDGLMDSSRQRTIEEMTLAIEELDDMDELMALLAPPVGAAFGEAHE
jgi:aconitate decarboxylase